jgi:hypothetical protein
MYEILRNFIYLSNKKKTTHITWIFGFSSVKQITFFDFKGEIVIVFLYEKYCFFIYRIGFFSIEKSSSLMKGKYYFIEKQKKCLLNGFFSLLVFFNLLR